MELILEVANTHGGNPDYIQSLIDELADGLGDLTQTKKIGIKFPKSFRPMRFEGNYKNFATILEKELNMKSKNQKKYTIIRDYMDDAANKYLIRKEQAKAYEEIMEMLSQE